MRKFIVTCIALQELLIDDEESEESQDLINDEMLLCGGTLQPHFYCEYCPYADEREDDGEEYN